MTASSAYVNSCHRLERRPAVLTVWVAGLDDLPVRCGRSGRSLRRIAVLVAAVATGFASGGLVAVAGTTPGWRVSATFGTAAKGELPGGLVVATAAADAFSYWQCTSCSTGTRDRNFIAHWNGRRWRRIALPQPLNYPRQLIAFSASSATNLWALTDAGRAAVWNGSSWTFRPVPAWVLRPSREGDLVASMAVVGPGNVWVFSEPSASQPTLVGHYAGGAWHKVFLPAVPSGIIQVSPGNLWALGVTKKTWATSHPVSEELHLDGSTWQPLTLPAIKVPAAGSVFYSLTATGPRDVWVGRTTCCGRAAAVKLLHWTGRWQTFAGPARALELNVTVPDGHGGVWIAGVRSGSPGAKQVFFHYGRDRWTWHAVPTQRGYTNAFFGLTWIPHSRSLWATGLLERGNQEIGDLMKFGP